MLNIETDGIYTDEVKRLYVINMYIQRDKAIYEKSHINVLDNMYIKATNYGMIKDTVANQKLVDTRNYDEFYSIFSLDDLCVLGY
jgi:hypothetical protein